MKWTGHRAILNRRLFKMLLSVLLNGILINVEYQNTPFVCHGHFTMQCPNRGQTFLKMFSSITSI